MPVAAFPAALARLLPSGAQPRLAVAVSGGADSSALALLAQEFCEAHGGEILPLIVDHGLRPDSAAEAALVAQRLRARGMAPRVLTLHGLPRGAGLQAAARRARYAALEDACAEAGFLHLLLGHHAADQAETVAMRGLRGPGGAEGIAAWSARGKILLLRPLLAMRPAALRDLLRARGMEWVEDPSNHSEKFERVRIRHAGNAALPRAGKAALPRAAAARAAREQAASAYLAAHACLRPEGFAVLDAASAPPAALAALIRMLGGAAYAPRQIAVAALAAQLRPASLGGVLIRPAGRLGPGWLLAREPAACAPAMPAMPGALWDGRFTLTTAPGPGWVLGALGGDAKKFHKYNGLPEIIRRTLPCLRGPGGAIIFPAATRFTPPAPATAHLFIG